MITFCCLFEWYRLGGCKLKQRKWQIDEKLAIVLEGIKQTKSVSEICREHQIAQSQYYTWRDKFLEGGKNALLSGNSLKNNGHQAQIEKLQKIIGKQAIQIEMLKKTEDLLETG
jgi:transposase-like protein